jgi:hypothetical protein
MASLNSHQKWTVIGLFILGFWSFCCIEAAILSRNSSSQQPCIANGNLQSFAFSTDQDADFIPQANQGISSIDSFAGHSIF